MEIIIYLLYLYRERESEREENRNHFVTNEPLQTNAATQLNTDTITRLRNGISKETKLFEWEEDFRISNINNNNHTTHPNITQPILFSFVRLRTFIVKFDNVQHAQSYHIEQPPIMAKLYVRNDDSIKCVLFNKHSVLSCGKDNFL